MMLLRRVTILGLCAGMLAVSHVPVHAQTAAQRRAQQREERARQMEQRRAQQQAAQRQREARPDTSPQDIDRREDGFTLRTTQGWLVPEQESANSRLTLIYINLPPGQRDAGSFRVYMIDQPQPQPLARIAEAWIQKSNLEQRRQTGEPGKIEIDGLEGLVYEAEGHAQGLDRAERAVFVQRGSRTYVFHTSTPKNVRDRVMQAARAVERSIKWAGQPLPYPELEPETPPPVADTPPATLERTPAQPAESSDRAQDATKPADDGRLRFEAPGIGLSYPAEWRRADPPPAPHIALALYPDKMIGEVAPGDYPENICLLIDDHPDDSTPAATAKKMAEEIPGDRLESTPIKIGGADAHRVVLRHKADGMDTQMMVICVIRDARQYIFVYTANADEYDQFLPGVNTMFESVQWTGKATAVADATPTAPPSASARRPTASAPSNGTKDKVAAAMQDLTSFDDAQIGLRFKHPAAWTETKPDDAMGNSAVLMQLATESFDRGVQPVVTFGVFDISPFTEDLSRFVPMTAMMTVGGNTRVHAAEQAVGGKPGYVAIYKGEGASSFVAAAEHRMQIYTFVYAAPDRTFEAWLPAVKALIDTVEWID